MNTGKDTNISTPRRSRTRALAGAGIVALVGAVTVPLTLSPAEATGKTVSNEQALRKAVKRSNFSDDRTTIRLGSNISFDTKRKSAGGPLFGDIDVKGDVILVGNGRTIDARDVDRIFDVHPGARLIVRNVKLTNGDALADEGGGAIRNRGTTIVRDSILVSNNAPGALGSGGALYNNGGTLRVEDSRLSRNTADRAGGAIEALEGQTFVIDTKMNKNRTGPTPGNGGAIHLTGAGNVSVAGSVVRGNVASLEGGGLWNSAVGTFAVTDTLVLNNRAQGAAADEGGGGLFNDGGTMTVRGSKVTMNKATGAAGSGGGILNNLGTLTVDDSIIKRNTAVRAGGGVEANDGTTTISDSQMMWNRTGAAPGNGGALHLTGPGAVTVDGTLVQGNSASAEGGGLWNSATGTFDVTDSQILRNTAEGAPADQGGGGLFNDGGTMTVDGSTIDDNVANGAAGSGGGIFNNAGALTVTNSTFDGNTAVRAGGGIETLAGNVTLLEVDLTNNDTGAAPGNGGGFHTTGAGLVIYTGGTVTGNSASNEGGGLWNSSTGTMTGLNLTVENNTAPTGPNAFSQPGGVFLLNGMPVTAQ